MNKARNKIRQPLQGSQHDLKYVQELSEELSVYVATIVFNAIHGFVKSIGVKDPDHIAKKPPWQLEKGFLDGIKNIASRLRGFIGRRSPHSPEAPFIVKGKPIYTYKKDADDVTISAPMTNTEWEEFEKQVTDYAQPYLDNIAEEFPIKTVLLGMASAEADAQGKDPFDYGKKSYLQIERERFDGFIPDSIKAMRERYHVDPKLNEIVNRASMHSAELVRNIDEELRGAIRSQVIDAYRNNLTPRELASNLYWMKDDVPGMKKHTAQILARDWFRVAWTETALLHERVKEELLEDEAKESLDDPSKAIYSVFKGRAQCKICRSFLGKIVRHVPLDIVKDPLDDSLKAMGIEDEFTDIAVWPGKNNIGLPQASLMVCVPVHPWCGCSLQRINPRTQEFDKEAMRVRRKGKSSVEEFVPVEFLEKIKTLEAENRLRKQKQEADRMKGIHKKDSEYYEDWAES